MADGTVSKLIFGIAGLVILTVITFVLISTIIDANVFPDRNGGSVNDEKGIDDKGAFINVTGYTLSNFSSNNFDYTVSMWNATNNVEVNSANYTLDQDTGIITNATFVVWNNVTINYTFTTRGRYEIPSNDMARNMTEGVNNVSEKIPTILLIAAVVLLFGVLVILVAKSRQMGISSGGSL